MKNNVANLQEKDFKLKGVYKFTLKNIVTGEVRVIEKKNLITTAGKNYVVSRLMQDGTPLNMRITHTALGTGATAPAITDTQLQTETFRKATASATSSGNVGYLSAYYTAPEVTGTFKEVGLFINGTSTANTGTLFSRVAVDITKSAIETLTIDYTITLS